MNNILPDPQKALQNCITRTEVPDLPEPYRGKVRDVYSLNDEKLGIVVTDRISAFDHIMNQAIPYKGQILNQLAAFSFSRSEERRVGKECTSRCWQGLRSTQGRRKV